jgi:hypothetical protein
LAKTRIEKSLIDLLGESQIEIKFVNTARALWRQATSRCDRHQARRESPDARSSPFLILPGGRTSRRGNTEWQRGQKGRERYRNRAPVVNHGAFCDISWHQTIACVEA